MRRSESFGLSRSALLGCAVSEPSGFTSRGRFDGLLGLLTGLFFVASLVLGLVACGDASGSSSGEQLLGASGGASGTSPVTNISPADFGIKRAIDVKHSGHRLVTSEDQTLPIGQGTVQFIENILSDGSGQFALEPVGAYQPNQPPAANWGLFSLLQVVRQSLYVRYRDFEVRDAAAFQGEWLFRDLGLDVTVAGRSCRRVDAQHLRSGRVIELSIDNEVGLVLDQRELDPEGKLLQQVTYQTLDLAPDLRNVVWYDPMPTVSFGKDADLESALGVDIRIPTNLPEGYDLLSIESLDTSAKGDDSGPWLRVTYTNGVDPLFFAANIPSAIAGAQGSLSSSTPRNSVPVGSVGSGCTMRTISLGRASAGIVELPTGLVFVVGRVSVEELADMVHSTLN